MEYSEVDRSDSEKQGTGTLSASICASRSSAVAASKHTDRELSTVNFVNFFYSKPLVFGRELKATCKSKTAA